MLEILFFRIVKVILNYLIQVIEPFEILRIYPV